MRRLVLLSLLALGAAGPADHIGADLDSLKTASTEQQAVAIEARILAAWHAQLTPSVQLLVERADSEMHQDKPKDAAADFNAAIELQPESADLWRRRAESRSALGDDRGAVADLAQALSREPRCFPALADLSQFAESRDDFKRALTAWQKLMDMDPKAAGGDVRLKRLQHKVMGQPA